MTTKPVDNSTKLDPSEVRERADTTAAAPELAELERLDCVDCGAPLELGPLGHELVCSHCELER